MTCTVEIILQQHPDQIALLGKREHLAALRSRLAEAEAELTALRAQLKAFEARYMRQVGVLYAEIDEIEARIVEREAKLYDSDAARQRADEARQRAQESHDAAFGAAEEPEEFDPPPNLKALFRELAKRVHPDLARDAAEQTYFHLLMARANAAYTRGDTDTLQQLLDDHRELHAAAVGESAAAESLRVTRQIGHAERDLAQLAVQRSSLLSGELAHLLTESEIVARQHRDLLAELATDLREQVADAQKRFAFVDRQVSAYGR